MKPNNTPPKAKYKAPILKKMGEVKKLTLKAGSLSDGAMPNRSV